MISVALARTLHDAGVRWSPHDGDRFVIETDRSGGGDPFDGTVFTVAAMTIEERRYETGSVLGFNGTTEWALDSVALEDALWLPSEHQLRDLLGGTFVRLTRLDGPEGVAYRVDVVLPDDGGTPCSFAAAEPSDAYAQALLALVSGTGPAAEDPR